jgi:endonuclease G, mitochondrial
MAAPIETDEPFDSELLKRARDAASRWDNRRAVREERSKALHEGRLMEADSPARLTMRVNHLIDDVRRASRDRQSPTHPLLKKLVERPSPVTVEELSDRLVEEVVINARDFLSVEFLERGLVAAASVGRVLIRTNAGPRARGTAFLVAPGLAITNEHVLTSPEVARVCALEMGYEQNRLRTGKAPQVFDFQPERFFLKNADLDFALVAVAERGDPGGNIRDYGWLPLNGAQGKIAITPNDYLNIIQHPMGREKEVVLRENRILDLKTGGEGNGDSIGSFIHYEADTEKGSSGSPVLSDQWEVVALHHSGVPARDQQGRWLNKDGQVWDKASQPIADIKWIGNEGIRTSSLVAAVTSAKVAPEQRELIDGLLSAQPPSVIGVRSEAQEDRQAGSSNSGSGKALVRSDGGRTECSYDGNTLTFDVNLRIVVSLGE